MLDTLKKPAKGVVAEGPVEEIVVTPPNFMQAKVRLIGTAPYVSNAMSGRSIDEMKAKQAAGSVAKKGKKRAPRDFDEGYLGSLHRASEGWYGFPAPGLRHALVSACRLVGFQMTLAKLSVFVLADGYDERDGSPLCRFLVGEPVRKDSFVKLASGTTSVVSRGFYLPWEAEPVLRWDADQFTSEDMVNLIARVGEQVGIGAGRHGSKSSTGMGWGTFRVEA